MHLYILLVNFLTFLALPLTLAKDGEGDSLPHLRDHGHDICVTICNEVADGNLRRHQACERCMVLPISRLDKECRDCSEKCRHKKESNYNMWYCRNCLTKSVNPLDWDGRW
jgi:hypothetical protein